MVHKLRSKQVAYAAQNIPNERGDWAAVRTDGQRLEVLGRFASEKAAKAYATKRRNFDAQFA